MKWLPKLMGFDYEILFKRGAENVSADALSRIHNEAQLLSLFTSSLVTTELLQRIEATWEEDSQSIVKKESHCLFQTLCGQEYAIRNKIIESQTNEPNTKTSETTGQTNDTNTVKTKLASELVVSNLKINRDGVIIEDWTSDDEEEVSGVQKVRPENQTVKTRDDKSGVSTRTGLHRPSINIARSVCTDRPSINTTRPVSTVRPSISTARPSVCTTRPSINTARPVSTVRPSISTVRPSVSIARPSVSTTRPVYATRPTYPRVQNMTTVGTRAAVNTGKGKLNTDLKRSKWVWRPKGTYLDHVSKDNGSFMLKKVEYVDPKGISPVIKKEFSVARTLQQNGVAERKNKTLIEASRTMLADSLLPIPFWAEAVNTGCYVLNRVLVTKPQNKTPYELLIDTLPHQPPPHSPHQSPPHSPHQPPPHSPHQSPPHSPHQSPPHSPHQPPPHSPHQSTPHLPHQSPPYSPPHYSPPRSYEAPLPEGNTSGSAEDSMQLKELMDIVPKLVTRIETLETELQQTKTTYGKAVLTLVKRVKILEKALKRKTQKVVISESEGVTEDQGGLIQDIDDDPLVSLVRESMKMKEKSTDFVTLQSIRDINTRLDAEEEINTGREEINIGIEEVSTGSTKVDSGTASKRGQREGKAPMVEEDIQATHKTKEQIRQDEEKERSKKDRKGKVVDKNTQGDSETVKENQWKLRILLTLATRILICALELVKDFTREDLIELYRLVMQKYGTNRPEDAYDRLLWSDLGTMFDPPLNKDVIWSLPLQ
ncbi:putative ribonuclease H-like domain-containing protein [Tanacetum coccineum]